MLSLSRAQVQSLIRELGSHNMGGKKKKRLRNKRKKISAKGRVGEGEYERDLKGTIYRS